MGQVLYRKYRSKSLDEIVGQEHITTTLSNAIKAGKISHAYLFTGPRGVGKTSIARILAYAINDIPYDESGRDIDIIEIDAASNRRIDEIRELRDKVHIAPTNTKYKVYIIDEVHMLTKEAFNALLKTLEEPPAHVVFILATTEAHKLPETIISRTQRFTFKPISTSSAVKHLAELAKKENIKIEEPALELIAEHGAGSFRDSISLLDQISSLHKSSVSVEDVQQMVGIPPKDAILQLQTAVSDSDPQNVRKTLQSLYDQGFQAPQIAQALTNNLMAAHWESGSATPDMLSLATKLIDVPSSKQPQTYLELVIQESVLESHVPKSKKTTTEKPTEVPAEPERPDEVKTASKKSEFDNGTWQEVLNSLKGNHNTLYGIARMAKPNVVGEGLELLFKFAFHMRRCNESRNREIIEKIIQDITGKFVKVTCSLANEASNQDKPKPPTVKPEKSATLDSITEVFGGGQILD